MAEKSFAEVMERFRTIVIDESFDIIVAIANGGIVPAGILAQRFDGGGNNSLTGHRLSSQTVAVSREGNNAHGGLCEGKGGIEVRLLRINLRDADQKPRYDAPRLMAPIDFEFVGKRVLLVDDRIKSGSTIRLARELLRDAAVVRTFAVNGDADYALYNEECFRFPWIL